MWDMCVLFFSDTDDFILHFLRRNVRFMLLFFNDADDFISYFPRRKCEICVLFLNDT
jgi:hypothetical protein